MKVPTRQINRWGEGAQLREEILHATARLLTTAVARDAVTLRAIAREAGIAAPSIYKHFHNREAILDAVVEDAFTRLEDACGAALASSCSGRERIEAVSRAYVAFGVTHSSEYRIMFERSASSGTTLPVREYPAGARAFRILVDAFADFAREIELSSADPLEDAQAFWVSLHGVVTLVPATPGFPWVAPEAIVDRLLAAFLTDRLPTNETG